MDRKYTASEFCCAANGLDAEPEDHVACIGPINDPSKHYAMVFRNHHIAEMLRQAADMMEREEKREKKYEFSVYPPEINGVFQYRAGAELNAFMLKQNGHRDGTIVRREVGEWEEVK